MNICGFRCDGAATRSAMPVWFQRVRFAETVSALKRFTEAAFDSSGKIKKFRPQQCASIFSSTD